MFLCTKIKKSFIFLVSGFFIIGVFMSFINSEKAIYANSKISISDKGIFLPIIMYHSILKNESRQGDYVISPEILENDISYLKEHGYYSVSMQDLINYVYEDVPLPEKSVMITFDDGFYNNLVYAIPILKKYEMKAVISIVGKYTEKASENNDKNPAYAYLAWTDISYLIKTGLIEIGNHTYDMHNSNHRKGCSKLSGETTEEYRIALSNDVLCLQNALSNNCGITPTVFTYPFGNISRESVDILKEAGFSGTFICYEKPNYITKNPDTLFGLNRYNRPYGISTEEFMKKVLSE